jgi:hypothetical protein
MLLNHVAEPLELEAEDRRLKLKRRLHGYIIDYFLSGLKAEEAELLCGV